jgi:large subunit ribosomal protein L25
MDFMEKIVVNATRRPITGKQVGALRREGKLPAVMYGHHFDATPILLEQRDASRALAGLSASQIITIVLDGKEHAALVREKQKNYIKNSLLHVDFQVVSLTEKIRTAVEIVLQGVSTAVKDYNGVVVTNLNEIDIEALPQDLPEHIVVDIAMLKSIGDAIFVRDLNIPAGVTVLTHAEEMVVNVTGVGAEEAAEEAANVVEPEIIEKGKKEEEEEKE